MNRGREGTIDNNTEATTAVRHTKEKRANQGDETSRGGGIKETLKETRVGHTIIGLPEIKESSTRVASLEGFMSEKEVTHGGKVMAESSLSRGEMREGV
jgi:hypothetical protein